MSVLRQPMQRLIGQLKADPGYVIRPDYRGRELVVTAFYRGLQVLRGLRLRLFLRSSGLIFCGRRVIIEHAYLVSAGSSLILEDDVFISGLGQKGILLGRNVTIARSSSLVCTGVLAFKGVGITIGDRSAVGAGSFLGGQGGITIGRDVIMGPGVRIFSENHLYTNGDVPIRMQGVSRRGVSIGDNCWIGAGTTVLDGVTVGEGCVVGAGSVVTKSLPPNSVAAGAPARVLRPRGTPQDDDLHPPGFP